MSVKKPISCQKFVTEVQKRLSVLYGESPEPVIGKNKVYFSVWKLNFILEKSKNKDGSGRRSIIDCDNLSPIIMDPVVIKHEETTDYKYYEEHIGITVHRIDEYIMALLGKSFESAIIADWHVLKWALLPMFISETTNESLVKKTQEDIYYIMAGQHIKDIDPELSEKEYEHKKKEFGFFYGFTARNINTDKQDTLLLFLSDKYKVTIYKVKLIDGKISDNDKDLTKYELTLDDYPDIQMSAQVKKMFRDYYDYIYTDGGFKKIVKEEPVVVEEEPISIQELIQNHPY